MASTSRGLLAANTADKIVALCGGLIACSLTMLAVRGFALDERLPIILVDDICFGRRCDSIEWLLASEALIAVGVIALLTQRPLLACRLGIVWSSVMLAETLGDLGSFHHDPRLAVEELAFVAIYGYLLALLIAYGSQARRQPNHTQNANGPAGASAFDRAAEPARS
jgi:hypothetical protein